MRGRGLTRVHVHMRWNQERGKMIKGNKTVTLHKHFKNSSD